MYYLLSEVAKVFLSPWFWLGLSCLYSLLALLLGIFLSEEMKTKKGFRPLIRLLPSGQNLKYAILLPFIIFVIVASPLGPMLVYLKEKQFMPTNKRQFLSEIDGHKNQHPEQPIIIVVLAGDVALLDANHGRLQLGQNTARFLLPLLWVGTHPSVDFILSYGLPEQNTWWGEKLEGEGKAMQYIVQSLDQNYGKDSWGTRFSITNPVRNTYEEVLEVKRLLGAKKEGAKIYVATSASHMGRALGLFKDQGIQAGPLVTNYLTIPFHKSFYRWSVANVNLLKTGIHEWIGDLARIILFN